MHPLKLAGFLYIIADSSLLLGGIGYDNWLLAAGGTCGMLGNASLLLGGSGLRNITNPLLKRVAPYAERLSMAFYFLQNATFILSGIFMYDRIIRGAVVSGLLGIGGTVIGLLPRLPYGIRPYLGAGICWLVASAVGIWAGIDSANIGVTVASIAMVLGAICVMASYRAEFRA